MIETATINVLMQDTGLEIKKKKTLDDYDKWFKPCRKCGYDTGKASKREVNKCWRCGGGLQRDFSNRALKQRT